MAEPQNPSSSIMCTEDILLFNILPRLPAKCVGRFMCVSRQWHSFLTTPAFRKLHLHHQNQNHQHKLLLLSITPPYMFHTIDCQTPKDGLITASRRPLGFDQVGSDIHMSIVASLHGLVCVKRSRFINEVEHTDLILWNPLTSAYKTLSKPSSDLDSYYIKYRGRFGLYYTYNSSADNDYKLLCLTHHPKVYIYSLKSDSWRKVLDSSKSRTNSKCLSQYFTKPSVLLNENLYFLKQKQIHGEKHRSYFIVMLDTKTERLREIATPAFKEWTDCMGFMVLGGSIHLSVAFKDSKRDQYHKIELWKMDGDGDWKKIVSYSQIEPRLSCSEKPLHIMRNGDWIMYCDGHVYQRDMKKHTLDIVSRLKTMEINQGWEYMETLVPPNQYMK